ncbi:hypothetical protein sS8_2416 [Methylocaldum marinum]|uniref:Ice-binding protein C-terminal domain-containing protein n=1 Tax=Methylocaldum marinum TaxID=1432792 RepID=A0A250KRU8_9GAMM|nr:PEP-CTERM sorting domain-containing protein [Methylocaldum marinum]BBA34368.1 hypothetical protein sS8_2416 [Methylocaldum marinum]
METLTLVRTVGLGLSLIGCVGTAHASSFSGQLNSQGYDVLTVMVPTDGVVDIEYTAGYDDPTFSLFDNSGVHLVTNDDVTGAISKITLNLTANTYSLLISYCCNSWLYILDSDAVFSVTDGFNKGSYWFSGTGTLKGMRADLDLGMPPFFAQRAPYTVTVTGAQLSRVPEPATLSLIGPGLLGVSLRFRRRD